MKLMPQLAFNGQCRQAFEQYERILGGKITVMNAFGAGHDADLPPGCTPPPPGHIRFAEFRVGDFALLGNDVPPERYKPPQGFSIALHLESVAEARPVFSALADGGRVTVPQTDVEWSPCFGMVTDRFGVPWLILALAQ
jgi:PhnB protein